MLSGPPLERKNLADRGGVLRRSGPIVGMVLCFMTGWRDGIGNLLRRHGLERGSSADRGGDQLANREKVGDGDLLPRFKLGFKKFPYPLREVIISSLDFSLAPIS